MQTSEYNGNSEDEAAACNKRNREFRESRGNLKAPCKNKSLYKKIKSKRDSYTTAEPSEERVRHSKSPRQDSVRKNVFLPCVKDTNRSSNTCCNGVASSVNEFTINSNAFDFDTFNTQPFIPESIIFSDPYEFQNLPTDGLEPIFQYLDDNDKLNVISSHMNLANAFANSSTCLNNFCVKVNKYNISSIIENKNLQKIPLKNLSIDSEGLNNNKGPLIVAKRFIYSTQNLELENVKFRHFDEFNDYLGNSSTLKSLTLIKCSLDQCSKVLHPLSSLKNVYLNKCNDNIFKALANQTSLEKMTIRNDDWTWNGFPHDIVNDILFNCKNIKHLVLIGSGTGSFFDSDNFSFKLRVLDTTMITFHWYVGIKNGRVSFLETQKGFLKELTIHKLPFDFDGGKVLKYIIEEMNLDKFYYGKTPLILGGKKQEVKEFEANEIQITSTIEMLRQFPSIKSFRFILSETDIASDEVEKNVNPPPNPLDLFDNLLEFEVIDNSRYRGTLGVYLGLFKKLRYIKKLTLKTQDRNINTLLAEFLPYMCQLREIYMTSKVPRVTERFKIINRFVPNLTKISVASQFFEEAKKAFRSTAVHETVEQ